MSRGTNQTSHVIVCAYFFFFTREPRVSSHSPESETGTNVNRTAVRFIMRNACKESQAKREFLLIVKNNAFLEKLKKKSNELHSLIVTLALLRPVIFHRLSAGSLFKKPF